MSSELRQLSIRVDDELFDRIEKYLEHMRKDSPGADLRRTDAARQLIIRGLEAEHGKRGR